MDEYIAEREEKLELPETVPEVYLGTVASRSTAGFTLTLDGQTEATQKRYRMLLTGRTPAVGARVVCVKISGTYVVLGEVGNPSS